MSLTAALLLGQPIPLPVGRRRRHMMEDGARRRDPDAPPAKANHQNQAAAIRNREAVHAAVVAGARTHAEIEDATRLSQSTVKKKLYELESWPDGPRISRDRRFTTHSFMAL
jgi:hypothetical protein